MALARRSDCGSDGYAEASRLAEDATREIASVVLWTPRATIQEAACDAVVAPPERVLRQRAKARW